MKNKKAFKDFIIGMGGLHNKPITNQLTGWYWKALEPFTDEECKIAFNRAIAELKFFPKPVELIELIRHNAPKLDGQARVMSSRIIAHLSQHGRTKPPDLSDDEVAEYLMTYLWPYESWAATILTSELKWWAKNFEEVYISYRESGAHKPMVEAPDEVKQLIDGIGGD